MTVTGTDEQASLRDAPTRETEDAQWVRVLDYHIRVNDRENFRILQKDVFRRGIYHFDSDGPAPRILDCGSNIGMSIIYFKHLYPEARIVGFEPDPAILPYLKDNLSANGLADVTLVEAALWDRQGSRAIFSDGKYGSSLVDDSPCGGQAVRHTVPCVRLRDYLTEPVDFVKMNIEGAEWEVLADSADRLARIRAMVIEYHHLPGQPRTLHKILTLLDERGFDYLINDFDGETNPKSQPPFRLAPTSRYYLLIYAQRRD